MPLPARAKNENIAEALSKVNIFRDDQGNLKERTNDAWKNASTLLDHKYNPKTLHLYARLNRNNILSIVKKKLGIAEIAKPTETLFNDSLESEKNQSGYFITEPPTNRQCLPKLFFTLDIEEDIWKSISPTLYTRKTKSGLRSALQLRKPWTDIIVELTYKKTKIPCVFGFKTAQISHSKENIWLRIKGKCNECDSIFEGHCLNEPEEDTGISIAVTLSDTRGVPHTGKRRLKGEKRIAVGKELLGKKAIVWRKEASKDMSFGDPEPSYLPNLVTLRKIRQEFRDAELGIQPGLNVFESLLAMKYDGEFAGYIKEIGLDEFYCIYSSDMQIKIFRDLIKSVKRIVIDATGGVVQSIKKPNGETSYVFLYAIVMEGITQITPIFQMLSARHTTIAISHWLNTFVSAANHVPEEVVSDFSLALLNAISLSFNNCKLKTYLMSCYIWLKGKHLQCPLRCFIRLDIAHLIKMMCKKKIFIGKSTKQKDFYIRIIGVLTTCNSIENFRKLLLSMFVVALSECDGQNKNGEDISSQRHENVLLDRIKTFTNAGNDDIFEGEAESEEDLEEPIEVEEHIQNLIDDIKQQAEKEAKTCSNFQRPNPYYLPGIVEILVKFAQYFPLWTNVMQNKFNSKYEVSTSAIVEAYFKDLKNSDLSAHNGPLRADKFISLHLRSIEAVCKFQKAATKQQIKSFKKQLIKTKSMKKDITDDEETDSAHLLTQENWKGKNSEAITLKKNKEDVGVSKSKESSLNLSDSELEIASLSSNFSLKKPTPNTTTNTSLIEKDFGVFSSRDDSLNWSDSQIEISPQSLKTTPQNQKLPNTSNTSVISISSTEIDHYNHSYKKNLSNVENENDISSISSESTSRLPLKTLLEDHQLCSSFTNIKKETTNLIQIKRHHEKENKIQQENLKKRKKRGKYCEPCPEIEMILERTLRRKKNEILRNGTCLNVLNVGGAFLQLKNTCPFDSMVSILSTAYVDNAYYKSMLDKIREDNLTLKFLKQYAENGPTASLYRERAIILRSIFEEKNNILDCKCNISTGIIAKLMTDVPTASNMNKDCDCPTSVDFKTFIELDGEALHKYGINRVIDKFLTNYFKNGKRKCRNCKKTVSTKKSSGINIFLETEFALDKRINPGAPNRIPLSVIPKKVSFESKTYILNGVVEFKPSALPDGIGHYSAYCHRITGKWEHHDDMCKKLVTINNPEKNEVKATLIIYTQYS